MEPPVRAICAKQTVINIVGVAGLDRMSPCGDRLRKVFRVNYITSGPLLQVFERLAEIFESLPVHEFHFAVRGHGCHQSRNSVEDQAKALLALELSLLCPFL